MSPWAILSCISWSHLFNFFFILDNINRFFFHTDGCNIPVKSLEFVKQLQKFVSSFFKKKNAMVL